jgi:flagella basal body P-ring formation protein FlgA
MPAPAAGTQRFVTVRDIADMLSALGEDVSQYKLSGVSRVAVQSARAATAPATSVPEDKAARMAALALGRVAVAKGESASAEGESAQPPVGLPVAVAVRAVSRGAIITAADIEMQQTERPPVASSRRAPMYDVNELIGMEAGRAIQVGEVVFSDTVRKPTLVKRGEAVTVVAQGGGIRVRTTARAAQEGGHGDLVQVESLDTKEKFDARVIGLREVGVLAPPRNVTGAPTSRPRTATAPFRRYLQASQEPSTDRTAAAFRKYQPLNGATHAEIR